MRSRWSLMLGLGLCSAPLAWAAEKVTEKVTEKVAEKSADEKAEDAFYANRMVISALEAEVKGDFAARERLLNEAAQLSAAPTVQAHRGMINVGAKKADWKSIDESMAAAAKDDRLLRYETVRKQHPDTVDGHLAMARWCLSRKMEDQARGHLNRVIGLAPDHLAARTALGYVRASDKWISPEEIARMQATTAAKTNSIQKHGRAVATLVTKMKTKSSKDRDAATAAFLALKDPTMVGAVEAAFNTPDVPSSKLLIDWMGQVDSLESSLVLTRYSVLHPDEATRKLASDKLTTRPLHDFVPEMLQLLSSPITMMVQPTFDRDGKLTGYRQAFGREGMNDKDLQIIDRGFRRVLGEGDTVDLEGAASVEAQIRQQAAAELQTRQVEMQRQNELIKQVNERIAAVIAKVSGKPLTTVAADMWKWWDAYNETEYQNYKPDRYKRTVSVSTYEIPTYSTPTTSENPECFVAGTPVVTQVGMKAIETIQPGDMVLNRDMDSGALRWKPVLTATTRPLAATMDIVLDEGTSQTETFRCSTGHLFWVSGKGWKKASELQPRDILHGAKSPVRVSRVETRPPALTYNLIVADAPNYFVGQHMILTHDVTPRETNRQQLPGQDHVRQLGQQRPARKVVSSN
jgi:hypothetical protein